MTNKNALNTSYPQEDKSYDDLDDLNNDLLGETEFLPKENKSIPPEAQEINLDNNVSGNISSEQEPKGSTESEEKTQGNDGVVIQKSKLALIKQLALNIQDNNQKLLQLLSVYALDDETKRISIGQLSEEKITKPQEDVAKIVEGVFDGEKMIGPDGKQYSVPANYASKSKLVEGDILKLTITQDGTFVYKQIGPIERIRVIGTLEKEDDVFYVSSDNKKWRILTASVTYFKGKPGDEAVILIPKAGESKWAAVENIISKSL